MAQMDVSIIVLNGNFFKIFIRFMGYGWTEEDR